MFSVTTLTNNCIKFTNPLCYFTPNIGDKRSNAKILLPPQPAITGSKLTVETLEQGVKFVQS